MKTLKFNLKNLKSFKSISFIVAIIALFSLSSCLKNNDSVPDVKVAELSVVNASPGLAPFDFVLDGQLLNGGAFGFTGRFPYVSIYAGARKFGIYYDDTIDSIKTGTLNALDNTFYSIYVVGEGSHPEFLTLVDSLKVPAAGKAQIRFLNLGVNTPAVNLYYGVDSTLFSNVNYKGNTAFVDIPGGKYYNFSVKSTSNSDSLTSAKNVLIESGKIYTLWTKGINNSTVDSLKLGLKLQYNN